MTDAQILLIAGSIGNGLVAAWTAYTVYMDRKGARVHREMLELKATERDDKEREHRHKMAEEQQKQVFELERMGRLVNDAKTVAVQTKREINRKLDEAKVDRTAQITKLEAKVDEGIHASNGYKELIAGAVEGNRQLREDFQTSNLPSTPLAAKSADLQMEGNEKLDEIARNTTPI